MPPWGLSLLLLCALLQSWYGQGQVTMEAAYASHFTVRNIAVPTSTPHIGLAGIAFVPGNSNQLIMATAYEGIAPVYNVLREPTTNRITSLVEAALGPDTPVYNLPGGGLAVTWSLAFAPGSTGVTSQYPTLLWTHYCYNCMYCLQLPYPYNVTYMIDDIDFQESDPMSVIFIPSKWSAAGHMIIASFFSSGINHVWDQPYSVNSAGLVSVNEYPTSLGVQQNAGIIVYLAADSLHLPKHAMISAASAYIWLYNTTGKGVIETSSPELFASMADCPAPTGLVVDPVTCDLLVLSGCTWLAIISGFIPHHGLCEL